MNTPYLGEPQTPAAISVSMGIVNYNWGVSIWSLYGVVGLAIGIAAYKYGAGFSFGSAFVGVSQRGSGTGIARVLCGSHDNSVPYCPYCTGGGLQTIRNVALIAGPPFVFFGLLAMVSSVRLLKGEAIERKTIEGKAPARRSPIEKLSERKRAQLSDDEDTSTSLFRIVS